MLLAHEFHCLTSEEVFQEIHELELLPDKIESVLGLKETLKKCAEKYGPSSRNWAVVGNGPNKVAADEIRIKLSELCYKSIPCDFTEDKKHIDLSTEPLTIVVANDLAEHLVQDTAKEVAIFKAHNGKPIVLCAHGEKRFLCVRGDVHRVACHRGRIRFCPGHGSGASLGILCSKSHRFTSRRFTKTSFPSDARSG